MIRTFVDINGNIQYFQTNPLTPQLNNIFQPVFYDDPYANSSLIITPTYSDEETDGKKKIIGYDVLPRPIFYTNTVTSDVNNDPELRKKIVRFFYDKFCTVWLPYSFTKLQKYLKNENGKISFIKTASDYEQKIVNDDKKIDFIIENIFTKHEMVRFLDKFVNKFNVNWYDLKTKHVDKIKSDLYDKLKNHMKRFVMNSI